MTVLLLNVTVIVLCLSNIFWILIAFQYRKLAMEAIALNWKMLEDLKEIASKSKVTNQ